MCVMPGLFNRRKKKPGVEEFHEVSDKVKVESVSLIWADGRIYVHLIEDDETSYRTIREHLSEPEVLLTVREEFYFRFPPPGCFQVVIEYGPGVYLKTEKSDLYLKVQLPPE